MKLRVMTYNIQIAVAHAHNPQWQLSHFDLPGIAEMIAGQNPDIVVLQEVDRGRKRSGEVDQARWLGDALGYYSVFGPSFSVNENGRQGCYGNALLSRFPIHEFEVINLWHREHPAPGEPQWVVEPRSCLVTRIATSPPIAVLGLHLSTTADQRVRQHEDVANIVSNLKHVPTVLMGDFNAVHAELDTTTLPELMTNPLADHPVSTYPNGSQARMAIDHIWVSRHWRVNRVWVVSDLSGVSDHNPVVADIALI